MAESKIVIYRLYYLLDLHHRSCTTSGAYHVGVYSSLGKAKEAAEKHAKDNTFEWVEWDSKIMAIPAVERMHRLGNITWERRYFIEIEEVK